MIVVVLIAILKQVLSTKEHGEYKLYRQMGGLIHDYSGNGFHGRNGNSVSLDSNDGVFTDRGIYLDGTNTYFLIHSNEFGSTPTFTNKWSFSMWIHILSYGPLLHRISESGDTSFKIRMEPSEVYVDSFNCDDTCVLKEYPLNFNYPLNIWFLLTLKLYGEDEMRFYENNNSVKYYDTNRRYSDRGSVSFTYIGTDSTNYQSAFVYYIEFNSGSPSISVLASSSNSGCNGYCYFSTSSSDVCNCDNCSLVESSQCLSRCDDPSRASDCLVVSPSCDGLYTLTHGCTQCPDEKWPVCDIDASVDLSSTLCHSDCVGCTGSTASDCLGCSALYINEVSGSCQCPTNSSLVGNECVCASSYFMSVSGSVHSCVSCLYPCSECSGSNSFCTACVQTGANLDSGICSCPSNSSASASSCNCLLGYFLEMIGTTYQCTPCSFPCSGCSGSSTSCTSCPSTFNFGASSCNCPSGSAIESNQCQCSSGFYLQLNTEYECIACTSPCQECSGAPDTCTACLASFNLSGSSCECPEYSTLVSEACECEIGKAMVFSSIYSCEDCLFPCLTCSGSVEVCTACEDPFDLNSSSCECPTGASLTNNQCLCESGFYLSLVSESNYECSECSYPCSECSTTSSNCTQCVYTSSNIENGSCVCPPNSNLEGEDCVCEKDHTMISNNGAYECLKCSVEFSNLSNDQCECPLNSQEEDSQCQCLSGYLMATSDSLYECLKCDDSCQECSGSTTFCVSCALGNAILKEEEGVCDCPENSTEFEGECVCDNGYILKDSKCEKTQIVDLNSFDSTESIVISSVIAAASVSTLLISDPSSIWIILNNIQMLSYMPYHTLKLPEKLETTCKAFKLSSLLPNIAIYLFEEQMNTDGLPERWAEQGVRRTHFFLNIGQILLVLSGYFCCFLVTLFLACVMKDRFMKYLSEFRYNVVLRLWVEMFIDLFAASVISFDQILQGKYEYMNIIGGVVLMVQMASILLIWWKLYILKNNFDKFPDNIKNRFCCLFYEFDLNMSDGSYLFYVYFMIRRAVCILGLYYLSSTPLLQLFLSSNGSFIQILLLLLAFKFNDKLNQIVTISIEVLFFVIYILVLYFNSDISDGEKMVVDYLSVGVVGLMGLILMINHLIKTCLGISERCRSSRQRVVEDISSMDGKGIEHESMVFARPHERRKHKSDISLNLENIY